MNAKDLMLWIFAREKPKERELREQRIEEAHQQSQVVQDRIERLRLDAEEEHRRLGHRNPT